MVIWCYQIRGYIMCTESGIKCQSTSSPQFIRGLLREINFNLNNSCVLLAHSVWLLLFFLALVVVVGALQPGVNGHLCGVEPWPRRYLFSLGSILIFPTSNGSVWICDEVILEASLAITAVPCINFGSAKWLFVEPWGQISCINSPRHWAPCSDSRCSYLIRIVPLAYVDNSLGILA